MDTPSTESNLSIRDHAAQVAVAVAKLTNEQIITQISRIVDILIDVRKMGGVVWLAGNGGSAANASHLTCHLRDNRIRAICLNDNIPSLTANANDFGWEQVFRHHVELKHDDAIAVFSTSGRSENVNAIMHNFYAISRCSRIYFAGWDDVEMEENFDEIFHTVEGLDAGQIEDVHSVVIHMIAKGLNARVVE